MANPSCTACPDVPTLERLLLGRLPEAEASGLEDHVSACPRCSEMVRSLPVEDALVRAMRGPDPTDSLPQRELMEAILPLLKRLRPRDATTTWATDTGPGQPAEPAGQDPAQFLAAPQTSEELGRLGTYRVLRLLGAGGMGMVFQAEDPDLQRQVALKVIRPELLRRGDMAERFLREARAVAAVDHENIVTVHHVGEERGTRFLVMPLLRGRTLEEHLREADGPLSVDEVLHIGREIAVGLAAAHQRGLIHRDIKPGNIWLEGEPGALATGVRVKILDFGLAHAVQGDEADPAEGSVVGTPAYMSPEQGRSRAIDARSDLFSLGCVLYRMATGRPAFQGSDLMRTLMSVALDEPSAPRQLNPALPVALSQLIEQLLAKRPEDRPPSAQAVVEAMQRIEAARQPRPSRRRWLLLTAAVVLLAVGLTIWLRPHGAVPLPPPKPGLVTLEFDEADNKLILQREDDPGKLVDLKTENTFTLPPGHYWVRLAADSPKGRRLMPDHFQVKEGETTVVPLCLVGEVRPHQLHSHSVTAVALSPVPGSLLALSASLDHTVALWDAGTEKEPRTLGEHGDSVFCVAFSADGKLAATGSKGKGRRADQSIRIWNLAQRALRDTLPGHDDGVTAVAFSPDGQHLLSGGADGTVFLWDLARPERPRQLAGHHHRGVHSVAFSADGQLALSCGGDGLILLWNPAIGWGLGSRGRLEDRRTGEVRAAVFAPEGGRVASADGAGSIFIWDLKTQTVRDFPVHQGRGVRCLAWSPDGRRLLSGSSDGDLRLWDVETGTLLLQERHDQAVNGVAFSADGRHALSGSKDRTVRLWKLPR